MLLDWARVYRSIMDMPATDRPSSKIIDNDAALDRWLEGYQQDLQQQVAKHKRLRAPVDESTYMKGME